MNREHIIENYTNPKLNGSLKRRLAGMNTFSINAGGQMDGSDRRKLMKAGFRILRVNGTQIREMTSSGGWRLVSRHASHTATIRALILLRQDDKTIVEYDVSDEIGVLHVD